MSAKLLILTGLVAILTAVAVASRDQASEQTFVPKDHPAIAYNDAPLHDPVTQLNQRLIDGKTKLEFSADGLGYLPSLLKQLNVNPDSQMLVFSKTSFQAAKISPSNPRALFFNDEVAIGSVRGGDVLEFIAFDPKEGAVFYTLDAHETDQPRFDRRDQCLQCHYGPATLGVPGIMVSSVYPDSSGMPAFRLGQPVTDHRTPFDERWGGWYVTGTHGGQQHRGNAVARDSHKPDLLETRGTQNITSLAGKFKPEGYLSQTSDIVALLTLEHQTRMMNLINRVAWEERIAEADGKPSDQVDADIDSLVTYMLFADELRLHSPVEGVSTFTKTFPERGPRDKQGRSLRDFDLQTRIFRYPLSYMIYSASFDAIPAAAKQRIYQRIDDVLTGKDQDQKFARLTAEDRRAILEILQDTKPGFK